MKYLSAIIHFFKSFARPVPARDWRVVIVVLMAVGVGLIGAGLYYYLGIQSGAIIVPESAPHKSPPTVSRDQLSKVLQEYEQRDVNYKSGNFVSK
jgi:hypothetical protein